MRRLFGVEAYYRQKVVQRSGRDRELVRNQLEARNDSSQNKKVKKKMSRNAWNKKNEIQEKSGIMIPKNAKDALFLDQKNGNNKWAEAISKEMSELD
eukprot:5734432-Ditylum_brightwellii.AAC.1